MESFLKRTWAEIDLDNVLNNYNEVKKNIDKNSKICCVIKADGYGHGATMLGKLYQDAGADWLGVSNLEEALELRKNGIILPILIFGYTPVCMVDDLYKNNIAQAVFSFDYASALSRQAAKENVQINIHLKIDTGMCRLGISFRDEGMDEVQDAIKVCRLPNLVPQGIFTHFAVSDEKGNPESEEFTREQLRRFIEVVKILEENGIEFEIRHAANSGGILNFPESDLDMVRAGIILYGLRPDANIETSLDLKPVMTLKSVVSQVKTVRKGSTVSYGRTYTAKADERLATVPVGYADGYTRALAGKSSVCINGVWCPVVGRVCMDQIVCNVTDAGDIKIGDEVIVFGSGKNGEPTADDIARWSNTINYEVTCLIGKRVARVYKEDKRVVATTTLI